MSDREVMQQALEAIRIFREWETGQDYESCRATVLARALAAEESLGAALAEPPAYTNREVMQMALDALDFTDSEPGSIAWEREKDACEALRAALVEQPEPPPEAQTEAEQRSYTFGWFKALEKSREMQEALQIIATPQRPDGTWNRDREACRQLAAEALGFHNKGDWK